MRKWNDFIEEGHISADFVKERPIIAIYGNFQIGKSTFLNCLLGHYLALAGKGRSTTALTTRYRHSSETKLKYRSKQGGLYPVTLGEIREPSFVEKVDIESGFHIEAWTNSPFLEICDIADTPGYNANDSDTKRALSALPHVHYILYVMTNKGFSQTDKELLIKLSEQKIPISIIMNCNQGRREERWIPCHEINQEIMMENVSWLQSAKISLFPICNKLIYSCNFLFYWSQMPEFELSRKDIDRPDTVIKHIKEILEEEGYRSDTSAIKELSGIPMLTDALKKRIANYNPITHEWR
uniref:dynamin family protein n=1 Tax=Agathobacter sp. TaxID=2021311 RepID=UPI0040570560